MYILFIVAGIALSSTATKTAWCRLHLGFDSFNSDIAKPVFKEVVGVGKPVTDFETKIFKRDLVNIVAERRDSRTTNRVVLALDMKVMKVVVIPAHCDLDDIVQVS